MTPSQTSELMALLLEQYPREAMSQRRLQVYCALLADLDHDKAKAAVYRVVAKSEFFPSVAAIRREYAEAEIDALPAELAWDQVLREIRRVGLRGAPQFDSPLVDRAVQAMGWEYLCTTTQPGVALAQFRDAYRAAIGRAVNDARVPQIARSAAQHQRLGSMVPAKLARGKGGDE